MHALLLSRYVKYSFRVHDPGTNMNENNTYGFQRHIRKYKTCIYLQVYRSYILIKV